MKKNLYVLVLSLVAISGLVFANYKGKEKETCAPADKKSAMEQWYLTPGGIAFRNWESSPAGEKVYASEAKIAKQVREYMGMDAEIVSLSLPSNAVLGFGFMAKIGDAVYIVRFDDAPKSLKTLQVGDKLLIKTHNVSHAPKYDYPIITVEYAERSGEVLYVHPPRKGGC